VPPRPTCVDRGPPYPEVTEANCRVPSTSFSQAPWYALPVHLCLMGRLFPGTSSPPGQSSKAKRYKKSVTIPWLTNINVIPIDYAFRPRLRGRLTLRRLTLRRNPWTFGDTVFHSVYRYSCQHSHFRWLQKPSRVFLHDLTERSATAHLAMNPKLRLVA
jgi:hypothetical protein